MFSLGYMYVNKICKYIFCRLVIGCQNKSSVSKPIRNKSSNDVTVQSANHKGDHWEINQCKQRIL